MKESGMQSTHLLLERMLSPTTLSFESSYTTAPPPPHGIEMQSGLLLVATFEAITTAPFIAAEELFLRTKEFKIDPH
jgi:hypothetical protein